MDMSLSNLCELVMDRDTWCAAVHGGHKESDMTELLNWNELNFPYTTTSLRDVAPLSFLGPYYFWCFAATNVAGTADWGTRMACSFVTFRSKFRFSCPLPWGGGRNGSVRESWCFVDTSVMFGAVRSPDSTSVVWGVGEQESWTLQWLEEESSCLTAASHSFSCGWCSWEAGISCTASLATNRFFVAVKSAAIIRGTTSPVLSILPLLCVPVNPPLGA